MSRHPTEHLKMLILDYIVRLVVAISTLALLSSIPAAGQATAPPKLSPQQLNPPTPKTGNKPIGAPTAYSPNKPIAVPKASNTSAFQRPVRGLRSTESRGNAAPDDPNIPRFGVPNYGGGVSFGPMAPCPSGGPRDPRSGAC
jgi:hypothetical protein